VRELRQGLWHWEAPHPEWEESVQRGRVVSSYSLDDGSRLLLFDPLAPPTEIVELAAERETAIVLTCPWHERDAQSLVERFGWPVFTPRPDGQEDLMRKYGVSAEDAAGGSPDLAWLLARETGDAHLYAAGDRLSVGVEAFHGWEHNDVVLWIASHRAVVVGDTLVDFGQGLEINVGEWLLKLVTREQVVERLRPLRSLPVEVVLATHGGPTDGTALERALSGA